VTASKTLGDIIKGYELNGLRAPKAALDALAAWQQITESLHETSTTLPATATVAERIEAIDRDAMRKVTSIERFREANETHEGPVCRPGLDACFADVDRVINKLRDRYKSAASVVVDGLSHYSPGELADRDLPTRGRGAAEISFNVAEATGTLETIRKFVNNLTGSLTGVASVALYVAIGADATPDTLGHTLEAFRGHNRWPQLFAIPGVVPALHTPDEADAVAKAARTARERAEEAAEAQRQAIIGQRKAERQREWQNA
jgi:hypothetical protein